jgi:hypothetical protein
MGGISIVKKKLLLRISGFSIFIFILTGCASTYNTSIYTFNYAKRKNDIAHYENFIRQNPFDSKVPTARKNILLKVESNEQWNEINRMLSKLEDIDGARYDDINDRLVIWGKEWEQGKKGITPLLVDDFFTALTVLKRGQNPGVSIGTISGRVPTQEDFNKVMRTKKLPVEYIPPSVQDTHMGSVLFEIDRTLKTLAHGEDNLTKQPVRCYVPGYQPVSKRLQLDTSWEVGKTRPLGLWWFVPEETGVAFEGYTIKFVRYRMKVDYKALVNDPAVEAFGTFLNNKFDKFADEFTTFRELVRLHKLVQVARWYKESGFPIDDFLHAYKPIIMKTPQSTKLLQTVAGTIPGPHPNSYYEFYIIGGIDLSTPNYYMPSTSLPTTNLTPGNITHWQPNESHSAWTSARPPRYKFFSGTAPVPKFVKPIFQARPAPTSYGWTFKVEGQNFAVASIPMKNIIATKINYSNDSILGKWRSTKIFGSDVPNNSSLDISFNTNGKVKMKLK